MIHDIWNVKVVYTILHFHQPLIKYAIVYFNINDCSYIKSQFFAGLHRVNITLLSEAKNISYERGKEIYIYVHLLLKVNWVDVIK